MQMIYPLEKDVCKQHIGKNVCVVFHDGSYMTGTLSRVTDEGLIFDGASMASVQSSNGSKGKRGRKKTSAVKTSAFYGYPYGGYGPYRRGFVAPWASIALLFLLPFLFI